MATKVDVEEFFKLSQNIPVVDVRSPGEFELGHIPGAYNIPIFTNEERAIVGTIYKKQGKEPAVFQGLDIVGLKLRLFAEKAKEIAKDNQILVHCWRGGMRSASMAWLFETVGIKTYILIGGYKAFRNYGKQLFTKTKNIVILGGLTGSGKTEILKNIELNGEQVVDLEGLAHHKGSAFGSLGQQHQKTNEQFENDLMHEWFKLDLNKPVWLEDESHSIGSNWIPFELFDLMREASVLKIEIPKNIRIKRLVKEYACFEKPFLKECIQRIGKRLGGQNVKLAVELLEKGKLDEVANITLSYYDKSYNFGLDKRKNNTIHSIPLDTDNPEKNAKILIDFYKSL
ncbi:MAG: tRNA 2-selenouridine(34) synthase MnmH [Bacteroidales bacterium]|nr:tRNA 2-selenouridine(34) synthase MnmH [Bacteroidales bacterium]